MPNRIIHNIMGLWGRFSSREKRLALLTAAVVLLMIGVASYQRVTGKLDELDMTLTRLEDELVSYTYQIAHRELVEARYAAVAAQHSSAWTEAEIHDRLRQEIYRLARKTPQALDEKGIPVNAPGGDGNLVEIPSLGKGSMAEGGQGYREYMINLRIPPCPLENIIQFLERLQESPQSLRIDALELSRAPDGDMVSASIDISRIIADTAPESGENSEQAPAVEEQLGKITLKPEFWTGEGAGAAAADVPGSSGAVEIQTAQENAQAFMLRSLPGGAVYEMSLDVAAAPSEITLGVGLEQDSAPFPGSQQVTGNGNAYRLQIQFTLPGDGNTQTRIKCPWILFKDSGAMANVSNLVLRKVSEV